RPAAQSFAGRRQSGRYTIPLQDVVIGNVQIELARGQILRSPAALAQRHTAIVERLELGLRGVRIRYSGVACSRAGSRACASFLRPEPRSDHYQPRHYGYGADTLSQKLAPGDVFHRAS